MLRINKITSASPVDFAAEELKKYLRMMMPECGDIKIAYDPSATNGFRLGLMSDFGLDTSDAEDADIDDILYIDCHTEGGIIAGSNPRSVLLSVYEYLRQNGCRWLFPGVDGELIPMQDIVPVKYRFKPSCRYRGQCNEGAEFQQCMLDVIDFTPKVGMNAFMIEFIIPRRYYDFYYLHDENPTRAPETISDKQILQWKRQCETEIAKRGLQLHDIGHGFTVDAFGIDSNLKNQDDSIIPPENLQYMAMKGGKRGLRHRRPICTNFCMSNPKAREIVADYVADYSEKHSNSEFLHVWLADSENAHCECDQCRKMRPTDWYMLLLNEIDEKLTKKNLDTKIVFIVYIDSTWAPLYERLKNEKRFAILFAPITRSYLTTLPESGVTSKTKPFAEVDGKLPFPNSLEEYLAYFKEWRQIYKGGAFAYEYHFWIHQCADLGGITLSERISEDIKAYEDNELNGVIEDGSQRSFFPTGLAFYTYARTLFDTSLSFEEIAEDYLSASFGEDWRLFYDYLKKMGDLFDFKYLEGAFATSNKNFNYAVPENIEKLRQVEAHANVGRALVASHFNYDERARTASVRLLLHHADLCEGLAKMLIKKGEGDEEGAIEAYKKLILKLGAKESEVEGRFDHWIYFNRIGRCLASAPRITVDANLQ